jgi:hypothetical protein
MWGDALTLSQRSLRGVLSGAALASLIAFTLALPAAAVSVPFKDINTNGSIGLCDENRKPVTSGSIKDQPFIWTAVSSAAAPKGFEKGKAVLYAFQPRRQVDPGEWSGKQLTASSTFTNPKHPMSQATNADGPLLFTVQAYPPRWDGLIQLRMYFAGYNVGIYRDTYPATTIRVTGERWEVVSGGAAACTAGRATSVESQALPASVLASPKPLQVAGSKSTSSSSASGRPLASAATGATNDGISGADVVRFGLLGVVLIGGATGGLSVWRRRRRAADV